MNILVIGEEANFKECQSKFKDHHSYRFANTHQDAKKKISEMDVIFDFAIERDITQMELYRDLSKVTVFLNTANVNLGQLSASSGQHISNSVFGFAGLPTFLNREILEVSLFRQDQEPGLIAICKELGTVFQIVDDRVGLVTPRIICMIINEAYYTVLEGTADKDDIDLAMKLGTNYPFGPFEWCQKIGVRNVYELLAAIYEDTKDERYKICPLLKKEYLFTQP
jgi:3-hydroxybutyryl-CoA dehydrogenase